MHQIVELRPAIPSQIDDLAVQHRAFGLQAGSHVMQRSENVLNAFRLRETRRTQPFSKQANPRKRPYFNSTTQSG